MGAGSHPGPGRGGPPLLLLLLALVAALVVTVHGDCGAPPWYPFAIPDKLVNKEVYQEGETVKYSCRPGYTRKRSSLYISCNNGRWFPDGLTSPFCVVKSCPHPGDLVNGHVDIKTDLSLGSKIEFSCNEGYSLIGHSTSSCEILESRISWSNDLPNCEIVSCPRPPNIPNGKHSGDEDDFFTYGSSVTYSCNTVPEGSSPFSLIGDASISCAVENKTTGVWKPPPPKCQVITCPQPDVPQGRITSGFGHTYSYRDTAIFECKRGYLLNGSHVIRCESDNQWYPAVPTCQLNSCSNPPTIPLAQRDRSSGSEDWNVGYYKYREPEVFLVGTELQYTCVKGFRAQKYKPRSVTCQANFTWSVNDGFCERICCPRPDVDHGKIIKIFSSFPGCEYGSQDTIKVSCNSGYTLTGDDTNQCQETGAWEPALSSCIPDCRSPKIDHGTTVAGPYWSKTFTVTCNEGYILVGKSRISCEELTSPQAPRCEALCPQPIVENGVVTPHKTNYQAAVTISVKCNSGYKLIGVPNSSCSENGTWSPELPKCEWIIPEGCEQVQAGQAILRCLPNPRDVIQALEAYKLSLEIAKLELEVDRLRNKCAQPLSSLKEEAEDRTPPGEHPGGTAPRDLISAPQPDTAPATRHPHRASTFQPHH
ncbi:C4b-binding protein alpha chain-like [Tachyglossus aculeatus]|uniref:C4b-binding protein alpha chain-like n=1 Tax=Tachyglossus aculeatus TaxID=9261 RepID=UPI0018F2F4A8|nr:C4b-binding protein alpha chain-like [Tachyglossus aculeatus]XP_038605142.1 C4b-binding protein alpha chain-like [Tachyglossus aculeatus]